MSRGIPPSPPLTVSDGIQKLLIQEEARVHVASSTKMRIGIILERIKGTSKLATHQMLGTSYPTVTKWCNRWEENIEELLYFELNGFTGSGVRAKDHEWVKYGTENVLAELPRCGEPKQITMAQENQIVALATESPEDHGIPMINWTYEMLAHVAKTKKILEQISQRHEENRSKKTN